MLPPLISVEPLTIKTVFFILTLYWLGMAAYLLYGASHWVGAKLPLLQDRSIIARQWYWPVGFCILSYIFLSLAGWLALHAVVRGLSGYWVLSWPGLALFFLQVALVSWFGPVGVVLAASLLVSCILMSLNYSRASLVILISGLWLASGLLFPIHPLSRTEVTQATFGEPFPYYLQPQSEILAPCQLNCDQNYPTSLRFHAFSGQKTTIEWQNLALSYGFMLAATILLLCGIPAAFHKISTQIHPKPAPIIPII